MELFQWFTEDVGEKTTDNNNNRNGASQARALFFHFHINQGGDGRPRKGQDNYDWS